MRTHQTNINKVVDSAFIKHVINELLQTTVVYCKQAFGVDDGEFNKLGFFTSFTVNIKVRILLPLPSTPAPIVGD